MNKLLPILALLFFSCTEKACVKESVAEDEDDQAIIFQFGRKSRVDVDPGLYFEIPKLAEISRIHYEIEKEREFRNSGVFEWNYSIASPAMDKPIISHEASVRWKISNPEFFYIMLTADENNAQSVLDNILIGVIRNEISGAYLEERIDINAIETRILNQLKEPLENYGIEITDLKIHQVAHNE